MTVKSTVDAVREMCNVVNSQINEYLVNGTPINSDEFVGVSTKFSLLSMIAPGVLVIGSPLCVGYLFGTSPLAGL